MKKTAHSRGFKCVSLLLALLMLLEPCTFALSPAKPRADCLHPRSLLVPPSFHGTLHDVSLEELLPPGGREFFSARELATILAPSLRRCVAETTRFVWEISHPGAFTTQVRYALEKILDDAPGGRRNIPEDVRFVLKIAKDPASGEDRLFMTAVREGAPKEKRSSREYRAAVRPVVSGDIAGGDEAGERFRLNPAISRDQADPELFENLELGKQRLEKVLAAPGSKRYRNGIAAGLLDLDIDDLIEDGDEAKACKNRAVEFLRKTFVHKSVPVTFFLKEGAFSGNRDYALCSARFAANALYIESSRQLAERLMESGEVGESEWSFAGAVGYLGLMAFFRSRPEYREHAPELALRFSEALFNGSGSDYPDAVRGFLERTDEMVAERVFRRPETAAEKPADFAFAPKTPAEQKSPALRETLFDADPVFSATPDAEIESPEKETREPETASLGLLSGGTEDESATEKDFAPESADAFLAETVSEKDPAFTPGTPKTDETDFEPGRFRIWAEYTDQDARDSLSRAASRLSKSLKTPLFKKLKPGIVRRLHRTDVSGADLDRRAERRVKKEVTVFLRNTFAAERIPLEFTVNEGFFIGNADYYPVSSAHLSKEKLGFEINRELVEKITLEEERSSELLGEWMTYMSLMAFFRSREEYYNHAERLARRFTRNLYGYSRDSTTPTRVQRLIAETMEQENLYPSIPEDALRTDTDSHRFLARSRRFLFEMLTPPDKATIKPEYIDKVRALDLSLLLLDVKTQALLKKQILEFLKTAFVENSLPVYIDLKDRPFISNNQYENCSSLFSGDALHLELSGELVGRVLRMGEDSERISAELLFYLGLVAFLRSKKIYNGKAERVALHVYDALFERGFHDEHPPLGEKKVLSEESVSDGDTEPWHVLPEMDGLDEIDEARDILHKGIKGNFLGKVNRTVSRRVRAHDVRGMDLAPKQEKAMKKRVLRFLDRAFVERSLPLEISSVNGYLIGNTQIPLTAAEMIRGSVFMEISSALQKEIFLNAIFSNRMIADLILYLALASYFRGNEFYSGRAETLALEFTRTITGNPETLAVFDNMRKMGIRATDYLMAETRDPGGKHEAFQNRFLGSARNTLNRTMMDPSGKKAKKEIAERFRSLDLSDTGLSSEQSAALKKKIIPFMRKTLKGTLPIEIIFREGSVIGNSRYALCRSAVQSGTVRMEISRELATDMLDRRPAFAAELALFLSMNAYFRTSTVLAPHSETLARRFTRVFTGEDPATPHNDLLRDYIENRAAAAERTLQDQERREEVVLDSRENAAETAALPAPSETPEITPPLEDEELFDENRLDEYLPEKEPAPSPKPVRGARLLSSFHRIPLLKKIPAVTVLTFLILTGFVFLDFFGPGVKRTDFAPPHPTIARAAYTDDARFDKKLNEIRMSLAAFKAADRMPDEATVVRTLFPGMLEQKPSGEEIRLLQRLLNLSGHPVALRGPGSLGNETRYFGKRTRAALEALQGNPASRHEELALETGKADAATLAVLVRTVVDSIDGMPLGDRTLSRADHDRKADAEAIVNLQRLLNLSETFALPSGPGMGSLGREVPAYGPKTENAVSALAKAMGIAPDRADGSFDPEQMGEFLKRSALKGLFDLDSPAYDGGGTGSVRVAGASPDGLTPEERERFARIEAKLVKRAKKESGEGEPSPDKTGKEGGPEFRKGNGPVTAAGIVEEDIVDPENGGGSRGPEGAYRPVYSLLESGLDSWVSETGLAELTESVVDFWTFRVDPGIDYSRENPELRDVVQGIYGDEIRASILVPYFRRQEIPPPASLEPLSRKIVMALIDTPLFQCASLPSDTGTFAEAPGAIHFPVNLTPRRPLDLFTRRGAGVIGPRTVLDAAQRWRIAHAPLSEEELARDIPEIVSSKTFRVAA